MIVASRAIERLAEMAMQPAAMFARREIEHRIRRRDIRKIVTDLAFQRQHRGVHEFAFAGARALVDALGDEHDNAKQGCHGRGH
jgi:hypothetical protein